MDGTTLIPTTPHRGFDPLIEDEEEACLVRRITLTSYDDLYRLEKASITPDGLPDSELTRFSNAFARCFGVFLFDVRLPHPTTTFLTDLSLWIKEHRPIASTNDFAERLAAECRMKDINRGRSGAIGFA